MAIGILKSSVQSLYILLLRDDRPLYSGTAIVVMSQYGPLLVTSRHLVTGRNQDNNRILSPGGTVPNQMKIAHNRRDELGEWVIREEKLYDENGMPRWAEHQKLRGSLSFPVWANGFIASEPAVNQFDLPTFLIDCRSRPGQAGSAVVAHSNGGSSIMSGGEYKEFNGPVTKLLGVFGGRLNKQSDLGIVWRLSAVREVVEGMGNTIAQQQQQEQGAEEEAMAQSSGRLSGLFKGFKKKRNIRSTR